MDKNGNPTNGNGNGNGGPVQTIRIEQAPLKIITAAEEPPVKPTV